MNDFSDIDSIFIKQNEGIIKKVLEKYSWLPDYEDILQEARVWLLEAKHSYDHKKSKWVTFATNYVTWMYSNYQKNNYARYKSSDRNNLTLISLDDTRVNEHGELDTILLKIGENDFSKKLDDELEAKYIYEYCLNTIKDEKIKDIVKMRLEGASCRIIAYKYKCTKQWISYLYKKEIDRIRNDLKELDWAKEFFPAHEVKSVEIIKEIKDLRKMHYSWAKICKKLHIKYYKMDEYINKKEYKLCKRK